jgi:hypothetical protein
LSPIVMVIYCGEKFFQSINSGGFNLFSGMMIVPYCVNIFNHLKSIWKQQETENQLLDNRLKIVWAFFYLFISGFIVYYSYYHEPNMGYNPLLILFGVFMMIDGNYQSVILPKNVVLEMGIGKGYEESVYRKSQRLKGRFQFYFGLAILILFLILPNTPYMLLYGIVGILVTYYIGAGWMMYKNTQIIAESEAKTK